MYANISGKGRIKTAAYKRWINAMGWELKLQNPTPLKGSVAVCIYVHPKMRGDIDNRIKACLDLLVKMGVIEDDKFVYDLAIYRADTVDRGFEIVLWPGKAEPA